MMDNIYYKVLKHNFENLDSINLTRLQAMNLLCHLGHKKKMWLSKNVSYIRGYRNGIIIINLDITLLAFKRACNFLSEIVLNYGLLFTISNFVNIGFTGLSNYYFARNNSYYLSRYIDKYKELNYSKNFHSNTDKKLQRRLIENSIPGITYLTGSYDGPYLGGLISNFFRINKTIQKYHNEFILNYANFLFYLPDLFVILNTNEHFLCIIEAGIVQIPAISLIDSDLNPKVGSYVIVSNNEIIIYNMYILLIYIYIHRQSIFKKRFQYLKILIKYIYIYLKYYIHLIYNKFFLKKKDYQKKIFRGKKNSIYFYKKLKLVELKLLDIYHILIFLKKFLKKISFRNYKFIVFKILILKWNFLKQYSQRKHSLYIKSLNNYNKNYGYNFEKLIFKNIIDLSFNNNIYTFFFKKIAREKYINISKFSTKFYYKYPYIKYPLYLKKLFRPRIKYFYYLYTRMKILNYSHHMLIKTFYNYIRQKYFNFFPKNTIGDLAYYAGRLFYKKNYILLGGYESIFVHRIYKFYISRLLQLYNFIYSTKKQINIFWKKHLINLKKRIFYKKIQFRENSFKFEFNKVNLKKLDFEKKIRKQKNFFKKSNIKGQSTIRVINDKVKDFSKKTVFENLNNPRIKNRFYSTFNNKSDKFINKIDSKKVKNLKESLVSIRGPMKKSIKTKDLRIFQKSKRIIFKKIYINHFLKKHVIKNYVNLFDLAIKFSIRKQKFNKYLNVKKYVGRYLQLYFQDLKRRNIFELKKLTTQVKKLKINLLNSLFFYSLDYRELIENNKKIKNSKIKNNKYSSSRNINNKSFKKYLVKKYKFNLSDNYGFFKYGLKNKFFIFCEKYFGEKVNFNYCIYTELKDDNNFFKPTYFF